MTLLRLDDHDPDGAVVTEAIPTPEYMVTYGCGQGMIVTADGRVIHYDEHVPGCEHEESES